MHSLSNDFSRQSCKCVMFLGNGNNLEGKIDLIVLATIKKYKYKNAYKKYKYNVANYLHEIWLFLINNPSKK